MRKYASIALLPFFVILVSLPTTALVEIHQVLYDPLATENGGEAVQLYNNGNEDADISSWIIATEASATDATLPDSSIIPADGYFLIADAGWQTTKDNSSWPDADYEETLNLYNTNSGLALKNANGTIIDALGWGDASQINAGLYEGVPAAQVIEGKVLLRQAHSGNNQADFIETTADFGAGSADGASQLEINLSVDGAQNATVTIDSVELSPDENANISGAQLSPVAGGKKNLTISAKVSGNNSTVTAVTAQLIGNTINLQKKQEINSTTVLYEGAFELNFTLPPSNYTIELNAAAQNEQATSTVSFDWLPLTAFELDSSALKLNVQPGATTVLAGDNDFSTKSKPTIRNIGNTALDIALSSQGFANGNASAKISATNIKASLDSSGSFNSTLAKTLASALRKIAAKLQPGEARSLSFSVYAPKTAKAGSYKGNITIAASS
jgi:hypothetical protein